MRNPIRAYIERLARTEMERHLEALTNTVMDNNALITKQLIEMGVIEVADGELRKAGR